MAITSSFLKDSFHLKHIAIERCEMAKEKRRFAGIEMEQDIVNLYIRPNLSHLHECPICAAKRPVYDHQSGEVRWRAPGINGRPLYFVYTPARIDCPVHGVRRKYIPWAQGNSRFTLDFCNDVAWMSLRLPKSALCEYYQISWETAGNCIRIAHENIEPDISLRMQNLTHICVDETSYAKGHKYLTVVYDMINCRAVWVEKNHGADVFSQFCLALTEEQRSQIAVVAGDGARWIDTCTQMYFPNAVRCVDPFHVVGWVNEALDDVRQEATKQAQKEYTETERRFVENLTVSSEALEKARKDLAEAERTGVVERQKTLKEYIEILENYKNQKK